MGFLSVSEAIAAINDKKSKRVSLAALDDGDALMFARFLSKLPSSFAPLVSLEFRDLSEAAVRAVVSSCAGRTSSLSLLNCVLGHEGFLEVLRCASFAALSVSTCVLSWTGVDQFLDNLAGSNLQELRLFRSGTEGKLGGLWNAVGKTTSVKEIFLGEQSIVGSDLAGLATVDIPSLKSLHINTAIGKAGVANLAQAFHCNRVPFLSHLVLNAVSMETSANSNHILAMIKAMANLPLLKSVDLSYNTMSKDEIAALCGLAKKVDTLKMGGMVISGFDSIVRLFEDARNLRGLKVVVDRLTLELATVLAKSILESRTLVELEVELEYGKRHSLEKKEIYSELLAAVERNQSGLRTCVVQVENYSMASEETNRDAIRIKEICEQRMQEYLQAEREKNRASQKKVVVHEPSVSSGVPLVVVGVIVATAAAFAFFHFSKSTKS